MGKAFDQIMDGLEDVGRFMGGEAEGFEVHVPDEVDVKAIRQSLGLSQPKFAKSFGLTVGRVRDWEQKRSPIDAPSRAFLTVLAFEPEAVKRAMAKANERSAIKPTGSVPSVAPRKSKTSSVRVGVHPAAAGRALVNKVGKAASKRTAKGT